MDRDQTQITSAGSGFMRRHFWKTLETVFVLVTFGFAIYNYLAAEELSDTLSTHYIGPFPTFISQLRNLVAASHKSLLIACDVPGYGVYSSYDDYVAYQAAVVGKVGKLQELKVIFLDEPGRKNIVEVQFRGADITQIKLSKAFRRFTEWSKVQPDSIRTLDEFERKLLEIHSQIISQDFRGKNVPTGEMVAASMPMFVWIADGKTAVFSIPSSRTPPSEEHAFITQDPHLIKQLTKIFRTYESKAVEK